MSSDALFELPEQPAAPVPAIAATARRQWRLSRLEVINWGTFSGHHAVDVPPSGLVFTGDSGSGKSSLLDAISTVLTPRVKLRYNAAAQDQSVRSSDRTIVSYMRGAYGAAEADDVDEIRTTYLRTGATFSGVLLRFDRPDDEPALLIKLFKLNAGQMMPSEVKEICILTRSDAVLPDFSSYLTGAVAVRKLKRDFTSAFVTDKHSVFQSRYRTALGIASDAAMNLLHRTVAAKNLGSLDDLFRMYMLGEPATFATADRAVEQFAQLSDAHESVVTARLQLQALEEICADADAYDEATARNTEISSLLAGLDSVASALTRELAEQERSRVRRRLSGAEAALAKARAGVEEATRDADLAHAALREAGGGELARLDDQLTAARNRQDDVDRRRTSLSQRLQRAGVTALPQTAEEFDELLEQRSDPADEAERTRIQTAEHEAAERHRQAEERLAELRSDLEAAKAEKSNLDRPLLNARKLLAQQLDLSYQALPFCGELMEVRGEDAAWRGALERLLNSLSRTMLVDFRYAKQAAQTLDSTHFGVRIIVQAVHSSTPAPPSISDSRSLVHKVDVRSDSPFAAWMHHTLSTRFDYTCVDEPAELAQVERGLTRAGQVKRPGDRFEKDDRTRVDDRRRWVMGFSTVEKVTELLEAINTEQKTVAQTKDQLIRAIDQRNADASRRSILDELADTPWAQLDARAAQAAVAAAERRLDKMTRGNTDLQEAQELVNAATTAREAARVAESAAQTDVIELRSVLTRLDEAVARAADAGDGPEPDAAVADTLRSRFHERRRRLSADDIATVKNAIERQLREDRDEIQKQQHRAEASFERHAYTFLSQWPAFSADVERSIRDRDEYRRQRTTLHSDGLPAHEKRFLEMLRTQSTRNIGTLNAQISRAFNEVRERIHQVNQSLSGSQFDRGRYLTIKPKERRTAEVQTFLAELREITTDAMTSLTPEAADEKFALIKKVIGRLGSAEPADRRWRTACLDTRRHVSFLGVETDANGEPIRAYESSTGLSGGQRQKLVVFCLAAALRYQLTDSAEELPEFSTVMLDEAFDKADETFARMALETFVAFGFQLILATPKKLLPILEDYVGAAVKIDISDNRDSRLAALQWEQSGEPE
ncbi:ATP-binding protein [Brevibacterium sp. UBA7493]|uniref:ATP-binding protein n=1 Tax=Brevibacterium sp. UBA7493 TaxID=1946121 RepID=UPI00257F914F|nr:ATP-binding protein [Brevibacterium sp. UBA7493]